MIAAQLYRCRTETVLGEYPGDRASRIQRNQCQITPVFLANPGLGDTEADAGHRKYLIGVRGGVIHWHSI